MALALAHLTVDCDDPQRVAAFWSAALGVPIDEGASEFFASLPGAGGGPIWYFIKVPEPKAGKNRMHVDLVADDRAAEIQRLVGLGATTHGDHDEWGARWTVLRDPEGNEFCVADREG